MDRPLAYFVGFPDDVSERMPSRVEMERRFSALLSRPAGSLLGRKLGLGDPDDPREISPERERAPISARG